VVKGIVFNIQRYSLHDGPGIRTIVFLKGCPLDCQWCSNPESKSAKKQIVLKPDGCLSCGKCYEVCPSGARADSNFTGCTFCGECAKICPMEALEIIGREMTVDEVLEEVEKDRSFFHSSGGGVTLSGGEPLVQHKFAYELIRALKKMHLHTAIETTGYAPFENAEKVLGSVDLILYDLKHMDDEKHKKYTGVSNALILENARRIAKTKKDDMIFRMPLIGGVNADRENLERLADFAEELGVLEVHLLPYHKYGEGKYKKLGVEYIFEGYTPDDAEIEEDIRLLEARGIRAKKGG
jgi:pyruvate formate lyase activating enzyme